MADPQSVTPDPLAAPAVHALDEGEPRMELLATLRGGREAGSLVAATLVVLAIVGLGKVAAFARELAVAAQFGASNETDGFFTAYALFNILWVMTLATSLAPALVPALIRVRFAGEHQREGQIAGLFVAGTTALGAVVALAGLLAADWIIRVAAPELNAEASAVGAQSVRLLSLAVVPIALAGALGAVLHAHERFAAAASSVLVVSTAMVVATLGLAGQFGVQAPSLGLVCGALLQLVILLPDLRSLRPLAWPSRRVAGDVLGAGRRSLPVIGLGGVVSARPALERAFAATFGPGLVTVVGLGSRTGGFFAHLLGTALGTVIFPRLARHFVQDDSAALRRTAGRGTSLIVLLTVPVAAATFAIGGDISTLLFHHGSMTAAATADVAKVVVAYAPAILLSPLIDVMGRFRYAQGDTGTPFLAAVAGLLVNWVVLGASTQIGLATFGIALTANVVTSLAILLWREKALLGALMPERAAVILSLLGTGLSLASYSIVRDLLAAAPETPAILLSLAVAAAAYLAVTAIWLAPLLRSRPAAHAISGAAGSRANRK